MTKHDDFFKQSKAAQATLKHAILKGYLATFTTATGRTSKDHRVGYIDGYAGPGEYENPVTGYRSEGSPSIAIDEIRHQLTLKEPRRLECVFIEKKAKYYDDLKKLVDVAKSKGLAVEAIHGDVTKHLPSAIERFDGIPLLVFLDPFGASLPHSASIPAVIGRGGDQATEVLLNFSVETLRRAGARIHEAVGAKGREANLRTMDRWLGGDWWREMFADPKSVKDTEAAYEPAERITDEYARRVCAEVQCNVFPVDLRRSASHKPLFRLMLFHPKTLAAYRFNDSVSHGHEAWRSLMWDMDLVAAEREDDKEPGLGLSRADEIRQLRAADPAQVKADTVETLKANIRAGLQKKTFLSMENDFHTIFGDAAGVGRGTHLTKAWDDLTAEGITGAREGSKYEWAKIWRASTPTPPTFG